MRSLFAVLLVLAGCASHEVVAPVDISGVPMSLKTDYTITGFDGLTDIAVDGNYLYTIDGSGLSIYDVTMPTSPVLLSASFADVVPSCVAISGTMALIPSNDAGMVIADITDKENPEIIGMDYDPVGAAKVVVSGTNAYVVGNQFHSYDISDPSAPVRLDTVNITGTGKDLAVSGTNAYIVTASASGEAASFVVVNIADPENLSVTSTLALPSTGQGLDISGDYAYVGGGSAGLHVLDISSTPEIVATLATSGALYGVDASGDYAYAAGYDAGFLLVDIENPLSPAEITTVDFAGLASDVIVSGDYAYVESSSAIYIIGLAEITPHTITATAGAHGSITPSGSVSVDYGEDQAFTITPDSGWSISNVLVDDVSVGAVASYTFEDVAADHTIHATFKGGFEEIRARVKKSTELRATVTKGTEIRAQAKKSTELRATLTQHREIRKAARKATEMRGKVRINIKEHEAGIAPVSLGVLFDTHHVFGADSRRERILAGVAWMLEASDLVAIAVAGDCLENPHHSSFREWLLAAAPGVTVPILPCVGNWDTELLWTSGEYGNVPASPFATMLSRYGLDAEHYTWDWGALRLVSFNSISDAVDGDGKSLYWNCNPPGDEYGVNPDYSTPEAWLTNAFSSSHPWKVGICHRPLWAACDLVDRPVNTEKRADLTDVTRDADDSALPEGSVLWTSGMNGGIGKTHAALLDFTNTSRARVRMWEASTVDPTGAVVYDGYLSRNRS